MRREERCIVSKRTLLWLDLEMTGLNAEQDVVLEIAVVATDIQLKQAIEGPMLTIHQQEDKLAHMDNWVRNQHRSSGLLEKVAIATTTVEQAEQKVLQFIDEYMSEKDIYLAGNSIYVDRSFLRKHMPQLNARCHYRMLDVSSLKILVQGWYPEQSGSDFKKAKTHRALDDIRESIAELEHYRSCFFIPESCC